MSLNRAMIIGHVGKDPEVRYLDSGIPVATITLATTEKGYTLANGTTVPDRTEWHNVIAWRGLAEIAEKYIKKGSQLYVEGKITNRKWEKDGITRYTTEIVADKIELLGKKPEGQQPAQNTQQPAQSVQNTPAAPSEFSQPGMFDNKEGEDDLPF